MTSHHDGTSPLLRARLAGFFALGVLVFGTFAGSVQRRIVVPGDAVATVENIVASESLFRLAYVSSLLMYTVFILYVVALYRLLRPVNRDHAMVMGALALVGVPIAMLNQVHQAAVLVLLDHSGSSQAES